MTITMIDSGVSGIEEIKELLKSTEGVEFKRKDRIETYTWIKKRLAEFRYLGLSKKEKGIAVLAQ